ncbi:MAG: sigma-54 dependent transcriptional regulator [Pseudomonadota bacterium]
MINQDEKIKILSLPGGETQPLSIRAKAMVFCDHASQELLSYIEHIAPNDVPVLITGETGTGKELVARHIHHVSGRKGPFIAVNCGAIHEQLAESELFGHEPGAFTGAIRRQEGWFEAAKEGTLFLDEIGDLPLHLQVKLLRVLQEKEVVRVGSRKAIPINIRLIAATNVDLEQAVTAGNFRLDLFYRLNIAQVRIPPLRERTGDIVPLANYFLGIYGKRLNLVPVPTLSQAVNQALLQYPWPGNIRELENIIHFALMVSRGKTIQLEHLKFTGGLTPALQTFPVNHQSSLDPLETIAQQLEKLFSHSPEGNLYDTLEHLIIERAYQHSRFNQVRAAELLGISRNVLRTLLKRHGFLESSLEAPSHFNPETQEGKQWNTVN